MLHFFRLELVPKSSKKQIGGLSCMYKGQKCIQTLWDHQKKKLLLLKSTKNLRYVRPLRKNTHFGAYPEAKKGVARAQVRYKCSQEAQKNAKPIGVIRKKCLFCRKSAILSIRWKFQI